MHIARHTGAALAMLRQLEFALFDFRLHAAYTSAQNGLPMKILAEVRDEVALITHPDINRLPHAFSHIFAGGNDVGESAVQKLRTLIAVFLCAVAGFGVGRRGCRGVGIAGVIGLFLSTSGAHQ